MCSPFATLSWRWWRPSPTRRRLAKGWAQAKDYAGKLQLRFTYASNGKGKGIYAIDMDSRE